MTQVAYQGTNPYLYTDYSRKIVYNERGIPLGSNGGISEALSRIFGFKLNMTIANSQAIFDNNTGKWSGMAGDVSATLIYVETNKKHLSQKFRQCT
jgi:hypothetical protein